MNSHLATSRKLRFSFCRCGQSGLQFCSEEKKIYIQYYVKSLRDLIYTKHRTITYYRKGRDSTVAVVIRQCNG